MPIRMEEGVVGETTKAATPTLGRSGCGGCGIFGGRRKFKVDEGDKGDRGRGKGREDGTIGLYVEEALVRMGLVRGYALGACIHTTMQM